MITSQRQLFYFVGDKPYKDLAEAQRADLISMMKPEWKDSDKEFVADWLLANDKAIVDTLTTTPKSRLRARKLHGAKRSHHKKPLPEEAKATA